MKKMLWTLAAAALTAGAAQAQNSNQGVSKDEIVLGSIQDLSGPLAGFSKQARLGMIMRVDELNEQGGVNGRRIKLIVEDSAYDPKKAVLAAQKLVNQDKVFAVVGHIGTAQNNAAMPVQFEKNVFNFLPLTGAREMFDPFHRMKYSSQAPYYDQLKLWAPKLYQEKNAKKACSIHQDDEFGLEVLRGAEDGLKAIGVTVAEKTTFKRGATDFSSQVQRLQAAGCDFVVLGTIIRETIGAVGTARKLGYNPTFIGGAAAYTELIHKLGGPAMNGIYTAHTTAQPYLDDASQPIRFWANKYKTKFNEDPSVFSAYGYNIIDVFIRAAEKAGRNLDTNSFVKAMDSMTVPADIFGTPELTFTATKRLGSDSSRLSQIVDGKWKVVYDYPKKK